MAPHRYSFKKDECISFPYTSSSILATPSSTTKYLSVAVEIPASTKWSSQTLRSPFWGIPFVEDSPLGELRDLDSELFGATKGPMTASRTSRQTPPNATTPVRIIHTSLAGDMALVCLGNGGGVDDIISWRGLTRIRRKFVMKGEHFFV